MGIGGVIAIAMGIAGIATSRYNAGRTAGAALMAVGFVLFTMALPLLISGKFYLDAGRALKSVVETQGNDIAHMMDGLGKLRDAVRLEAIVAMIAVVLGVILALVVAALFVVGVR